MSFWKWSRTAANNATADGSIDAAQGQALDGRRFRARHDGGGVERPLQNIGSIATISSDCGCIYV
jgi:hypothetical protein